MDLKDILIRRMSDLDIDQDEVARRSGISQAAISKMVVGKTKNTKFPAKIARAIQVKPYIFMAATEGKLTVEELNLSLKETDTLSFKSDTEQSKATGMINPGRSADQLSKYSTQRRINSSNMVNDSASEQLPKGISFVCEKLNELNYTLTDDDVSGIIGYINIQSATRFAGMDTERAHEINQHISDILKMHDSNLSFEQKYEILVNTYNETNPDKPLSTTDKEYIMYFIRK